jgi:hypothetical protein
MAATADSRGREASTPREIPARGWLDIARRVKDQIKRDRLSIIAAGVAFYGLASARSAACWSRCGAHRPRCARSWRR